MSEPGPQSEPCHLDHLVNLGGLLLHLKFLKETRVLNTWYDELFSLLESPIQTTPYLGSAASCAEQNCKEADIDGLKLKKKRIKRCR
jgi:hypothetical protein